MTPTVTVVGAGIAGLGAAHALQQAGCRTTVLERSRSVGGRMATVSAEGFSWEPGAHFMWRHYREMIRLCAQLSPPPTLHPVTARAGVLLPDGSIHYFRTDSPLALLRHPGLTLGDAGRLGLALGRFAARARSVDPHRPEQLSRLDDGRSVLEWGRRAVGSRATDAVLTPAVSSLAFWPPEETPWWFALGVLALTRQGWFVPGGGMGEVPARLARALTVRSGVEVCSVRDLGAGGAVVTSVDSTGRRTEAGSDAVIVAVPGPVAARLLTDPGGVLGAARADYLSTATYHRSAPITLAYRRSPERSAYGIAIPVALRRPILAIGWEHLKLPGRNPDGTGVATVMPASTLVESHWDSPDEDLVAAARDEVERAYPGSAGQLAFGRVHRWEHASPRMTPGRYRQLAGALAAGQPGRGVFLCGDYWAGPSTEFSLTSGLRAAAEALAALGRPAPASLQRLAGGRVRR